MSSIQDTDIRFKLIRKHIVNARIPEECEKQKQGSAFLILLGLIGLGIVNVKDISSNMLDVNNLLHAIIRYIDNDEYDIQKIMDEIEKAYYTVGEGKDENNN